MNHLVERGLVTRVAKTPDEKLTVKREGDLGKWHARTEDGELICVDKYRHDLQSFVEGAGFTYEMQGKDS